MIIKSITKTTLLDYPGKVASTIFLVGCNMRCCFCHNSNLIKDSNDEYLDNDYVLCYLKDKVGKIDGVCITGGEPTINEDLVDFIRDIKNLGLLVKLDTNGTNPNMLIELINSKLVDYIAMDVKNSVNNYSEITNSVNNLEDINKSIDIIKSSGIDHEFRTTIINIHKKEDILEISKKVSPSKYFLQEFRYNENILNKDTKDLEYGALEDICSACNLYTKTEIRKK